MTRAVETSVAHGNDALPYYVRSVKHRLKNFLFVLPLEPQTRLLRSCTKIQGLS